MSWLETLTSVLFVGHSLFSPTNPQMLDPFLPDTQVQAQIINGAPLKHNWDHGDQAQINARALLPRGKTDALILTEAVPLANHLEWSSSADYAQRYYDLALAANPDTRVFLQETWHSLNSGTDLQVDFDDNADIPWRDRLDQDLPRWQSIVDAVNATRSEDTPPMVLIPAGQAMAALHDAIDAGQLPGLTDIRDVFADDIHPNDTGFYFLTMLQYAVLTGAPPMGLPTDLRDPWGNAYATPPQQQVEPLQQIAWTVAQTVDQPPRTQPTQAPQPAAAAPASEPEPARPDPPASRPDMAIGLAGVNDWSTQQPFLDVMKTARPWIGHLPRQWGGATHEDLETAGYLDPNGWPLEKPPELSSIGTMLLTDLPEQATTLAGRYRLMFDGNGIVEVTGRARNVRYGKNQVEFDFAPGPGSVDVRIQRSDRARDGNYIRNIRVVKLDHLPAYQAGAVFNPDWLDRIMGFQSVRFMDWMLTNNSTQATWDNRPRPEDYTWARQGVPAEIMIELANRIGADPWFNMPHLADDTYMRQFAQLVRDTLWRDHRAYVELSNEVWNWQFEQAAWADAQARDRWGKPNAWLQYYALRASEMARIWGAVFTDAPDRLVRVITTQTGWLGLEADMLAAPLWRAEDPQIPPVAKNFDVYAVTGYFGGGLGQEDNWPMIAQWIDDSRILATNTARERGLTGVARDEFIAQHQYDMAIVQAAAELRDGIVSDTPDGSLNDLLTRLLPYHAGVAAEHGLDMVMYEGGTHVVGLGPMVDNTELTAFFQRLNYSPEMGALYRDLIRGWQTAGGTLFNAYVDVYAPTKWGSWGTLRYLSDDNPRWDAVAAFR